MVSLEYSGAHGGLREGALLNIIELNSKAMFLPRRLYFVKKEKNCFYYLVLPDSKGISRLTYQGSGYQELHHMLLVMKDFQFATLSRGDQLMRWQIWKLWLHN